MNETYSAWECSALREVHIVLDTNKTFPKRRDYLFSFNLNLDLFTLALENLYFNTLDREKVQGKSLSCIKSLGTPHPRTPIQGATAKGWKSRMRLGSLGLPTPGLGGWTESMQNTTAGQTAHGHSPAVNSVTSTIWRETSYRGLIWRLSEVHPSNKPSQHCANLECSSNVTQQKTGQDKFIHCNNNHVVL